MTSALHQAEQNAEREAAGQLWTDGGWVFATPTGAALIPRSDWDAWKQLLRDAELRDARLHDARHTAATVLLLLGVSERAMTGIMGWSNPAMARRDAHMIDAIHHDIADRIDGLLWSQGDDAPSPRNGRPAGQLRPQLRPLANQPLTDETGEGLICAQFGGGGGI